MELESILGLCPICGWQEGGNLFAHMANKHDEWFPCPEYGPHIGGGFTLYPAGSSEGKLRQQSAIRCFCGEYITGKPNPGWGGITPWTELFAKHLLDNHQDMVCAAMIAGQK